MVRRRLPPNTDILPPPHPVVTVTVKLEDEDREVEMAPRKICN